MNPLLRGVAQDARAELLVHEDPGALLGDPARDGGLEGVVDHVLDGGDLRRLFRASGPSQPNMVFENVARWSKGSTYRGLSYPIAMDVPSRLRGFRLPARSPLGSLAA